MAVSLFYVLAGRQRPGEVILWRVRNRLIEMWSTHPGDQLDTLPLTSAIAWVDHCLSRLRAERVNR